MLPTGGVLGVLRAGPVLAYAERVPSEFHGLLRIIATSLIHTGTGGCVVRLHSISAVPSVQAHTHYLDT